MCLQAMHATAGDAVEQLVLVDDDADGDNGKMEAIRGVRSGVGLCVGFFRGEQSFDLACLLAGSRISVEDEAANDVGRLEAGCDHLLTRSSATSWP